MVVIRVSQQINQPQQQVWETIADLSSHPTWMKDAVDIEFVTDQTSGVGTIMNVETKVGPFWTKDVLEVIDWKEGHHIVMEHRGVVTGNGRLAALADGGVTLVTWTETLRFPWWLGGALTAWLARPVLRSIWRGNLQRLNSRLSSP